MNFISLSICSLTQTLLYEEKHERRGMKGETKRFIKIFLWIIYDDKGPIKVQSFEGQNLIKSIMIQFQHDNKFMHWDDKHFGFEGTPEEKSLTIINKIEDNRHKDKIIVLDISNPVKPVLLFPKDKRNSDFDDSAIGYQYTIESFIKAGEDEDQAKFGSFNEVKKELEHLQTLQPENVYRIRNVTKKETIVTS